VKITPAVLASYAIGGIIGGIAWALFSRYVLKDQL